MTAHGPAMEALVARQAIFDRHRRLYAYELLYRSAAVRHEFDGTESTAATGRVISNALLSIGLDNLLSGRRGFVNFDSRLLETGMYLALPKESIVLEILETVRPTQELLNLCQRVREHGYSIALDDFVAGPLMEPLTGYADVIKVDFRATPREEQERLLQVYKSRGIRMLAEKVETYEEFEWALNAGYDFFQGYFFARPVVVSGRQIPSAQPISLRLLRESQRLELNYRRLEKLIRGDVSLAFQLLRYANSALFGRRVKTSSITQALVTLGDGGIRRWAALATLPALAAGKPNEIVTLSILRARFCERLAQISGRVADGDAFIAGMFSLLDVLMDRPLADALDLIELDQTIRAALEGTAPRGDALSSIYQLVRGNEAGDWARVEELALSCGIPIASIAPAYMESAMWAEKLLRSHGPV